MTDHSLTQSAKLPAFTLALAISVMVDSPNVMIENAHKHLEHEKAAVERGAVPKGRVAVFFNQSGL